MSATSDVAARIQDSREAIGMSPRDFAKRAGLDFSSIRRIELGKSDIQISTLKKICLATGRSADWFMGLTMDDDGWLP